MSIRKSEKIVLQKLIKEISIVDDITKRYSREEFLKDVIVQRAVAMTIINIGELTTVLSEDFRDAYPQVPWRKIKGLRNIMAHKYQIVDFEDVWETAVTSIPELEKQLCEILRDYK
jgi:uncharacterized protein with HEPN domain